MPFDNYPHTGDVTELAALFHRRWAVPIIVKLHRAGGAKFVTLVHRLGANQGAVRQTLDALVRLGLVLRNSGHGHPLRPEYLLTARGEAVAPGSDALMEELRSRSLDGMGQRKWPLPVLHALGEQPARYTEIRQRLPGITDRALAGALKDLHVAGLLTRTVVDAYPPVAEYAPTPSAGPVRSLVGEIAGVLVRAAE